MEIPKEQDIGWAASEGNLKRVKELLAQNPRLVDKVDKLGKTPLAWAVLQQNKQNKENYPQIIMLLLNNGANIHSIDKQGLTILHNAVRGGDIDTLKMLLDKDAYRDLDKGSSQEKGRTPLAELIRDSKDSLIHLDIEKENFNTPQEFRKGVPDAVKQLVEKESKKSSNQYIIQAVRLLKQYGADSNIPDAQGHAPSYYINNTLLLSQKERESFLTALGEPANPLSLKYGEKDLEKAKKMLQDMNEFLKQFGIGNKVNMVIWAVDEAKNEKDGFKKLQLLRITMALLARVKEDMKKPLEELRMFKDVEANLDDIRTIFRDIAIQLKNELPSKAQAIQPVPLKVTPPTQPQKSCPQKISPALMLYEIKNDSNNKISIKYTDENNSEKVKVVNAHQTVKLNTPLKIGQMITLLKSEYEQIGIIGIDLEGKINIVYQRNDREGTYNWNPFTIRVNEKDELFINSVAKP